MKTKIGVVLVCCIIIISACKKTTIFSGSKINTLNNYSPNGGGYTETFTYNETGTVSTMVKNNYKEGEGACQFSTVSLITDAGPIIIPLSVKGCVSDLNLFSVDWIVFGKTANLSGFGADLSNWVKVSCKSTDKTIRYYVNDRQAFEFHLPAQRVKIVGLAFTFQGTGSVKNIWLKGNKKTVFKAF